MVMKHHYDTIVSTDVRGPSKDIRNGSMSSVAVIAATPYQSLYVKDLKKNAKIRAYVHSLINGNIGRVPSVQEPLKTLSTNKSSYCHRM